MSGPGRISIGGLRCNTFALVGPALAELAKDPTERRRSAAALGSTARAGARFEPPRMTAISESGSEVSRSGSSFTSAAWRRAASHWRYGLEPLP
jgi:hypothetical protein